MMVVGSRGYSSIDIGILNTIRAIYRAHGIRGYYRGIHLSVLKIAPSIYLQFVLYDFFKSHSSLSEKEPSFEILNKAIALPEKPEGKQEPEKAS